MPAWGEGLGGRARCARSREREIALRLGSSMIFAKIVSMQIVPSRVEGVDQWAIRGRKATPPLEGLTVEAIHPSLPPPRGSVERCAPSQ